MDDGLIVAGVYARFFAYREIIYGGERGLRRKVEVDEQ